MHREGHREREIFRQAVLEKQEAGDDPKNREQLRLPARKPGEFHPFPPPGWWAELMLRFTARQVSGVFLRLLGLLRGVRGIFREQLARAMDHLDPAGE